EETMKNTYLLVLVLGIVCLSRVQADKRGHYMPDVSKYFGLDNDEDLELTEPEMTKPSRSGNANIFRFG
ncbi:hypothetical protein Ciccas_014260, partial [Cichlidogyrus casuarinus]